VLSFLYEPDLNQLVRNFLEYLEIERNCSKLTIRNYSHYLNILIDFLTESKGDSPTVDDINMESVRKFRLHISRMPGISGEMMIVTQGYYVIALRSFLKWLIRHDIRLSNLKSWKYPRIIPNL
jgi:integrase/recombinase XerD